MVMNYHVVSGILVGPPASGLTSAHPNLLEVVLRHPAIRLHHLLLIPADNVLHGRLLLAGPQPLVVHKQGLQLLAATPGGGGGPSAPAATPVTTPAGHGHWLGNPHVRVIAIGGPRVHPLLHPGVQGPDCQ